MRPKVKVYGLRCVWLLSDVFVVGENGKFPVGGFDSSGGSLHLCRKVHSVIHSWNGASHALAKWVYFHFYALKLAIGLYFESFYMLNTNQHFQFQISQKRPIYEMVDNNITL